MRPLPQLEATGYEATTLLHHWQLLTLSAPVRRNGNGKKENYTDWQCMSSESHINYHLAANAFDWACQWGSYGTEPSNSYPSPWIFLFFFGSRLISQLTRTSNALKSGWSNLYIWLYDIGAWSIILRNFRWTLDRIIFSAYIVPISLLSFQVWYLPTSKSSESFHQRHL